MAILDEESLLATCAYIDLNPVAAGIVKVPEASAHTSIKERVEHVDGQGRTDDLEGRASKAAVARLGAVGRPGGVASGSARSRIGGGSIPRAKG